MTRMRPRRGQTGSAEPSRRATSPLHGPQAFTTTGVAMRPRLVTRADTRPPGPSTSPWPSRPGQPLEPAEPAEPAVVSSAIAAAPATTTAP